MILITDFLFAGFRFSLYCRLMLFLTVLKEEEEHEIYFDNMRLVGKLVYDVLHFDMLWWDAAKTTVAEGLQ